MADNADIRILVGAEGGATSGGDLIKKELKAYFKDGIKIKVNLDDVSIGSIKAKISDQIASGQSKAANTALNNEFKLYNAQQRRIAQERMYENINISIKGHGDARLKQLGQQYALMEKSSDAAKKIAEQEYIAYNNQQRMLAQERMYANIDASVSGDLKNDKNYQDLKKYFTELEKVSAAEAKRDANIARRTETINSRARSQMASFKKYLQTLNPRVLSEHMAEANLILEDFKAATISVGDEAVRSFEKGANGVKDFKAKMKNLGAEGGNIFTYLHSKLKTFIVYLASSAITMGVVSGIKNMISTVRDLDKALTDLRIVTGDSKSAAQELLSTYNEMAQVLGSTTSVVAKSADDWLRQGYNLVDTNQLIKDSMVLSIVGQMDSAEATSSLTAAMKGYSLEASEAIEIVDKFTRVDLEAATSAGHLATALSKTAANAKISGLSLNDVIGQLAVVNETMKEAGESTGTFYNTMLSRMGSIKSGELVDPESAESLSDVETTLNRLGITLRDSAGEFRNFGDVLDDVGRRWKTFSLVDQRAIAQSFGGTRQQTRFFALMEGWEQAQKYSEAAANSAGTAMEKFGAYQESLEAKQNRLTASFERFSQSIIDSGLIGTFLDIQTALFNFGASVPDVIKNITMLTTAILATAAAIKAISVSSLGKAIGGTFTRLYASLRGLPEVLSSMKSGVLSLGEALEYLNINKLAFGIGSAVAIGYGLYKLIDWLHVSLDEQKQNLAELSQNYKELQSQIGDVNDELSTTRDRINEINSKETLSIAEESELQMLQKTNDALATQIRLLEKKIAIEERRLGDEIVETFRSEFGDGLNLTQSAIDQYVVDIPIVLNLTADESNISAMLAARKILQDLMISADSLEDFDYYKEYIDDVDLSLIASAETLGDYKSKLDALIKLTPEQTKALLDITEALDLINKYLSPENLSIDEAGDAASQELGEIEVSLGDLSEPLSDVISKYDILNSVMKSFTETGKLTADDLSRILEVFGEDSSVDLTKNVAEYIAGMRTASELLDDLSEAYKSDENRFTDSVKAKLSVMPDFFNGLTDTQKQAISSLSDSYGIDLDNFKDVESKKLQFQAEIIRQLAANYSEYTGASLDQLKAQLYGLQDGMRWLVPGTPAYLNAQKRIDSLKSTIDAIEEFNTKIENIAFSGLNFNPENFKLDPDPSKKTPVERYVADIEKFRNALRRVEDTSRLINTAKAKMALVSEDDIDALEEYTSKLTTLYKEQQRALHVLNNERDAAIQSGVDKLRSIGFSVEYDSQSNNLFIKNLELLNKLGSNLDTKKANEYRKEVEGLIKNITEWNNENVQGSLEWLQIQKSINDLLDSSQRRKLDLLKKQKDNLTGIVDLTKQLIKQEQNDIIDALKSQTDKYREIVELKKRSLQLTKDEQSYQDSVDSKNTEISKLQARIDALSLDDSREAQSQRASLLEQLAEKQKELTDIQTDYSDEKQQEALDSEIDRFEDTQDAKIAEIKKFLDNNHALTKAAMARIDRQGDALFKDLLRYSLHYTNTTEAELTSMWANAKSAVEEYGSAMRALETINARVDIAENKSGASSASKNAVVAQMKANSEAWWSADESEKNRLANLNKILGSSLGATIDKGVWWLNGKKLYDHTFHTGTPSAGRIPTPKQNELWALVEKGESVLTENQQNGLLGMFKNLTSNLNISGDLTAIASSMLSSLKGASNGVASVDASIRIEGPVSLDEEMKSFIKRYPKLVAEEVNKVLAKA